MAEKLLPKGNQKKKIEEKLLFCLVIFWLIFSSFMMLNLKIKLDKTEVALETIGRIACEWREFAFQKVPKEAREFEKKLEKYFEKKPGPLEIPDNKKKWKKV